MSLAVPEADVEIPKIVIRPSKGWASLRLRDVWDYRELLWILALRDIKVRYKQTFLGAAWAVLQPASTVIVFTSLFLLMGHAPSGNLPYPVAVLAALLPSPAFALAADAAAGGGPLTATAMLDFAPADQVRTWTAVRVRVPVEEVTRNEHGFFNLALSGEVRSS